MLWERTDESRNPDALGSWVLILRKIADQLEFRLQNLEDGQKPSLKDELLRPFVFEDTLRPSVDVVNPSIAEEVILPSVS